ncbi:hypothetical protein LCGC14_3018770 [marine sediment metagenome]|uniref:Uncharacterized protein n=1 Tax=marine sediment metagenome TaxID=412755 RepID=A0A0F8Z3M1_9ZZZZ
MTYRELQKLMRRLSKERRNEAMKMMLASKVEQQRN